MRSQEGGGDDRKATGAEGIVVRMNGGWTALSQNLLTREYLIGKCKRMDDERSHWVVGVRESDMPPGGRRGAQSRAKERNRIVLRGAGKESRLTG